MDTWLDLWSDTEHLHENSGSWFAKTCLSLTYCSLSNVKARSFLRLWNQVKLCERKRGFGRVVLSWCVLRHPTSRRRCRSYSQVLMGLCLFFADPHVLVLSSHQLPSNIAIGGPKVDKEFKHWVLFTNKQILHLRKLYYWFYQPFISCRRPLIL